MKSILSHRKNINTQNGEDGIIEYIFDALQIKNGAFIEFGAWDGKHLSNCYKLFSEGWHGVFIEGDKEKYRSLNLNFESSKQVCCLNTFVGSEGHNSLDRIIDESKFKDRLFDFVSIDVDGLDYFIFEKTEKYLPKVLCIEVSSGHSPDFHKILSQEVARNNVGQSICVMGKLGEQKGFFPVGYCGNLFLIKNSYKDLFKPFIKSYEDIYKDFLSHIIGPDKELTKYLFEIYCSPDIKARQKWQQDTFGYIFPENTYLSEFCKTRLFEA
jgi:hypothetical protein